MVLGNVGPVSPGSDLPPIEGGEGVKPKPVSKKPGSPLGGIFATQTRNEEIVSSVLNNELKDKGPIARFVSGLLRNLGPEARKQVLKEVARRDPKLFPAGLTFDDTGSPKNISNA